MLTRTLSLCYTVIVFGAWRSLVARSAGGREVAGSNPVAPIFPYIYGIFEVLLVGIPGVPRCTHTSKASFLLFCLIIPAFYPLLVEFFGVPSVPT